MALTALEMVNEVLDNLARAGVGVTRSGTTLSTMALRWLNRAQVRIYRQYDFMYKIATSSTVDGQQSYSFPSNMSTLYSMRVEDGTNSAKLRCVMPWQMDELVPKPNEMSEDRPTFYVPYKDSNTYELYPIPDATYTMRIRYSIVPAAMTIASSQSDYSDFIDLDDVLIYYATEEGYLWLQELADAAIWKSKGDSALKSAMNSMQSWPDWMPISKGFIAGSENYARGEYYNDPFVRSGDLL